MYQDVHTMALLTYLLVFFKKAFKVFLQTTDIQISSIIMNVKRSTATHAINSTACSGPMVHPQRVSEDHCKSML